MFCLPCCQFWETAVSKSNRQDEITSCQDIHWTRHTTVLHHSIQELLKSYDERCSICRAIYVTPTTHEWDELLSDAGDFIDIILELDPHRGPSPFLLVSFVEPGDATKVLISKRMLASCTGTLVDDDLAAALEQSSRLDNSSTGSEAAFQLASFWLQRCLKTHEECRVEPQKHTDSFVPTRLLDVADNKIRLINTKDLLGPNSDRSYVALSHCWGTVKIIVTLNGSNDISVANYKDHLNNIPMEKLSKTFKEAVFTTRKLNFRYLWIDSLCIIQDDDDDWAAEAATMCDVYRNATLTIVAAHAPGGDVGCFNERDGVLQFPFMVGVPTPSDHKHKPDPKVLFTSFGRSQVLGDPEPPLYGRAWTLQEQLLSPRMLIYDGLQLRWECLRMFGSERTPMGGMTRQSGHHQAIRKGIINNSEFFDIPDMTDKDFASRAQHQYWCYSVMGYTHRGMTKPRDRLVAIDGIAQALGKRTSSRYLAGLWSNHLWSGLLWSIPFTEEHTPTVVGAFNHASNKTIRHPEPLAPSWSWASVTVPVVYPVPTIMYLDRMCDILDASVSGTPAKQTGRIELRGHTRTGYITPIYQHSIPEARHSYPEMTVPPPSDQNFRIPYRGRLFYPTDFFIFSLTKPPPPSSRSALSRITSSTRSAIGTHPWRLIRGEFRPDQLIDPCTELTFLAIGQRSSPAVYRPDSLAPTAEDPLKVFTIALVPTGNALGEYSRVGYAVWDDCAWYGYVCGAKERPGRGMPERAKGWRGWLARGDLEGAAESRCGGEGGGGGKGKGHFHGGERGEGLPNLGMYGAGVGVRERVLSVV